MNWKRNISAAPSAQALGKGFFLFAFVLCFSAAGILPAIPQDDTSALKVRVAAQGDPVARARAFPRYGEALIREAREAARNREYEKTEKILTDYRDAVKQLHEDLRQHVSNPEKRPNGFKQLQIHVRKTLKELEDIVASVPAPLHPPFRFLQKEIEQIDRGLIDDLFPRKPGKDPQKGKV